MTVQIAERWFERQRIDDGITLLWEPHVVPLLRCNIWHVRGRERDLMIDTGMGISSLKQAARDLLQKPVTAVATHVHADHIGGHYEFEDCLIHQSEAPGLRHPTGDYTLVDEEFDPTDLSRLSVPGYPVSGPMITAMPHAGYDLHSFRIRPARVTRTVEDGDRVDLGDRSFEVLHLPGHSPGSIALYEKASGILFSGDVIYDGPLAYEAYHTQMQEYVKSMKRVLDLSVSVAYGGHFDSFGQEKLREIARAFLDEHDK